MRGLRFHGPGRFGIEDMPMPDPGPLEVRVRPVAVGICGTDTHILDGSFASRPPVVLGHEFAGHVDAAGSDVVEIREGDLVAIEPHVYCGLCRYCRTGREHLCLRKLAFGVHLDGGMAEAVVVPERTAYRLPQEMDPRIGALAEPVACCVHAMDRLQIRPGLSLALFGAGPAGLVLVALARLSGAEPIVVLEPDADRRAAARTFGASAVVDAFAEDWREQTLSVVGADGFDYVIEAVGAPRVLESAIPLAARGGRVLVFGVADPNDTVAVKPQEVFAKELTILGTVINPFTHHRAVELLPSLGLERLSLRTFPLHEYDQAFKTQRERGAAKVQLSPQVR
jgi:threonine dehydrogenase-like Zn-dependent dehydrogenase